MKKIIICSILMLFCLNSCYYIKQAILDEELSALRRKGAKKRGIIEKDSIFDAEPWEKCKEEKKTIIPLKKKIHLKKSQKTP